jgi:hypothetical protein
MAVLYSLLAKLTSIGMVIVELLFVWLIAWFIDYLCRNGYPIASWIIALFPIVFGALMTIAYAASTSTPILKVINPTPASSP